MALSDSEYVVMNGLVVVHFHLMAPPTQCVLEKGGATFDGTDSNQHFEFINVAGSGWKDRSCWVPLIDGALNTSCVVMGIESSGYPSKCPFKTEEQFNVKHGKRKSDAPRNEQGDPCSSDAFRKRLHFRKRTGSDSRMADTDRP